MFKEKREGAGLDFRAFLGRDGNRYLVFRSFDGSFHAFVEVEAKQAAKECGAVEEEGDNRRSMWESLWSQAT